MGVAKLRLNRRHIIAGAVVLAVAITGTGFYLLHGQSTKNSGTTFATLTANITRFQPYQLEVLDGFVLNDSTINYSDDVLIFQLKNNLGQKVAVTEQPLPDAVASGVSPSATQVQGVDGTGIITYNGTATTGALFSTEHRGVRTMVLINTSDPISQSTIQDMLRGLRSTN